MKRKALLLSLVMVAPFIFILLFAVDSRADSKKASPPLTAQELDLAKRLESHVRFVASVPHNISHYRNLEKSAAYIEQKLEEFGYVVGKQEFRVDGVLVRNIDAVVEPISGSDEDVRTLVVGAHYDSFFDSPGANDNGTGVAATLELSRVLRHLKPAKTRIRFVFFVNEEPPYFHTKDMGSWRYAKSLAERNEDVVGMMSLETIGAFSNEPGSQRYPKALENSFPNIGNFVAFAGLPGAKNFLKKVIESFRRATKFPAHAEIAPEQIHGFGMSDHWSFYKFGFPAIMITDTAPFRNKHYHLKSDTPDNVQYNELSRITNALEAVLRDIVE